MDVSAMLLDPLPRASKRARHNQTKKALKNLAAAAAAAAEKKIHDDNGGATLDLCDTTTTDDDMVVMPQVPNELSSFSRVIIESVVGSENLVTVARVGNNLLWWVGQWASTYRCGVYLHPHVLWISLLSVLMPLVQRASTPIPSSRHVVHEDVTIAAADEGGGSEMLLDGNMIGIDASTPLDDLLNVVARRVCNTVHPDIMQIFSSPSPDDDDDDDVAHTVTHLLQINAVCCEEIICEIPQTTEAAAAVAAGQPAECTWRSVTLARTIEDWKNLDAWFSRTVDVLHRYMKPMHRRWAARVRTTLANMTRLRELCADEHDEHDNETIEERDTLREWWIKSYGAWFTDFFTFNETATRAYTNCGYRTCHWQWGLDDGCIVVAAGVFGLAMDEETQTLCPLLGYATTTTL